MMTVFAEESKIVPDQKQSDLRLFYLLLLPHPHSPPYPQAPPIWIKGSLQKFEFKI